ncbi:MAG: hypothetical protein J5747_00940 [Spirochaetaceae bacterium]|nr:hypothetical protein [Spirochaetaceae bacterium]
MPLLTIIFIIIIIFVFYFFLMRGSKTRDTSNSSEYTEKPVENITVIKKHSFFGGFLSFIIIICLLAAGGIFAFKKLMVDYTGTYATDRLTYTDEYGICLLITYHPQYQKGNAKGYAITHISVEDLISGKYNSNHSNDTADSEDLMYSYQLLASYADNDLVNSFSTLLTNNSTKSFDIGNNGKYFLLTSKSK